MYYFSLLLLLFYTCEIELKGDDFLGLIFDFVSIKRSRYSIPRLGGFSSGYVSVVSIITSLSFQGENEALVFNPEVGGIERKF